MKAPLRRLAAASDGSTITEFAIVLPVFLTMVMGLGDLLYQAYMQSVLNGAVQNAGRDSTIQGNESQGDAIDDKVRKIVSTVSTSATYTSSRVNYDNYAAMAGEPFTDSRYPANSSGVYDGICNHGESYTDLNGNGRYDLNLGAAGQGGASDVTYYTMKVTYNRLFPVARLIGWDRSVTLNASTILKNQPYATQTVNKGTKTGTCT